MNREQLIAHLALLGYVPIYACEREEWPTLYQPGGRPSTLTGGWPGIRYPGTSEETPDRFIVFRHEQHRSWDIFSTHQLESLLRLVQEDYGHEEKTA